MNTLKPILATICLFTCVINRPCNAARVITHPKTQLEWLDAPPYSNTFIEERLFKKTAIFEIKLNKRVKKHIGSYLKRGKKSTAQILGRASMYFPIIDQYLELYHLPSELKYLAVIESALKPEAVSSTGAAGFWQFMPATARQYGLRIDDYVDERLDLHRSTDAALRYLSELHARYQDWGLAIAAYNCGPGRVDQVLHKSKVRDFWNLKKHLPKETQRYVEKFIAASYAMNNYLFYDIHPKYPDYNLQMITSAHVFNRRSFQKIADMTGIPLAVVKQLNPSYKKSIIPPNKDGYYLLLPRIGLNENWDELFVRS